jgi:hypothetical protein
MAKFVKAQKASPITKELYASNIEPQRNQIQATVLNITSDIEQDVEQN